ncbi:MAG: glycoside hydrolase family 88 protein, partial [Pseudomonadota bacterium]
MDSIPNDTQSLMQRVADRLVAHEFQCWFYGDSIGFEGLLAASELIGDRRWSDFSQGFFRGWATRAAPYQADDNTAPGHAMCAVAGDTGDDVLKSAIVELAEHLADRRQVSNVPMTFEDCLRSLREPYGDVAMSAEDRAILKAPGAGIYVDCLHFDPPFLAHLAQLTGAEKWSRAAIDQALGYRSLLRDETTGLYHHFWLEQTGRPYIIGWGRGQGWALLGLLD